MVISIGGQKHWLWRAVDANGDTIEILVQSRRNSRAATRFMRKLMKRWDAPRVIVTDKLRSYGVAIRNLCPGIDHRSHKRLNNRCAVSHRHTRRQEKVMGRSNPLGRRKCSCRFSTRPPRSFVLNAITFLQFHTVTPGLMRSASGPV